ncbi:hypothetical protein ACAG03_23555, partial [Escherichia coli]
IIPNDIDKYRQVLRYRDIYEKVYPTFNAKQKLFYEHAVKRIIKESESPELVEDLINSPVDVGAAGAPS